MGVPVLKQHNKHYEYKIDFSLDNGEYYLETFIDGKHTKSTMLESNQSKVVLINALLHEISISSKYQELFTEDECGNIIAHCSDGKQIGLDGDAHVMWSEFKGEEL